MAYDIIVYGTVCLDLIWRVPELAPPNGYQEIEEERRMIGGEATNTAVALSRWGVRVALVGNAIGDDADGKLLLRLFERDAPEIETRFLTVSPDIATSYCVCIATPDGHRTMYGRGFLEMHCPTLTPELTRSTRFFTTDPNPWDSGLQACLDAAAAGLHVVPMDYTRSEAVNRVSSLILTSSQHVGPNLSAAELKAYAASVRDRFGATTLLTHGEQGCYLAETGQSGNPVTHVPAYLTPEIVDTTGAGDIFRAGVLYGALQEWDIQKSARFASAAAALNCGAMGGWGGVRSVEEIEAFQAIGLPR